jgi:isoleucyl-tRNA synthetase
VIFHPEESYHDDIRSLERYLVSELNVRDVIFTTDEQRTGVKYRAVADWPVLGKKLRKDVGRVRKALPDVPSDEIKTFIDSGKITVDGIELITGDITVLRYVDLPSDGSYATTTDNDVVVVLDVRLHPELESEGVARELINRIQRLRKKAGLQATDEVDVFYSLDLEGARNPRTMNDDILGEVIKGHSDMIVRATRGIPRVISGRDKNAVPMIEEEQEIGETKFKLSLSRPVVS